jgi:hypothetical protein
MLEIQNFLGQVLIMDKDNRISHKSVSLTASSGHYSVEIP